MVVIDGSYEEGGGQILRNSLALSALTGRPFRLERIRSRRPQPGLKAQHLAAVQLLARMTTAEVEGDHLHSTELSFSPQSLQPGHYSIDVGTAGSVTLLLQAALLPALFAGGKVELELVGGTDVRWAPPANYLSAVLLPFFRKLGTIWDEVGPRGFFPKGKGRFSCSVQGLFTNWQKLALPSLEWVDPIKPSRVRVHSLCSHQLRKRKVAERQANSVLEPLSDLSPQVVTEVAKSLSLGSSITVWAEAEGDDWPWRLGADQLGEKGLPAEKVGLKAARLFRSRLEHPHPIEEHLADNLVPILALVGGRLNCQEVTPHTRANCYVSEKFLGRRVEIRGSQLVV